MINTEVIGCFLKDLRKEKGMTQEKLAEIVNVSTRSISRWENGNNLPDLDVLIFLADYYEIELMELLNGKRRKEKMDDNLKEVVLTAVEYNNDETQKQTKKINTLLKIGGLLWVIVQIIAHTNIGNMEFVRNIANLSEGLACGLILIAIIQTSKYQNKLSSFKQRIKNINN